MVRVSPGAIALSMIVISTPAALAADDARADSNRSSIEWLFDDLGAVFGKVVALGTMPKVSSPESVPAVEQSMPAPTVKPSTPSQPVVVDAAPAAPSQTPAAPTENPFAAIFDAIASFFAENPPNLVVENETTPVPAPAKVEAQPEPVITPPAHAVDNQEARETDTPRNSVSWLLEDIGKLFKGDVTATVVSAPSAASISASPPAIAPAPIAEAPRAPDAALPMLEDNKSSDVADTGTHQDPISWLLADIGGLFKGGVEATPETTTTDAAATSSSSTLASTSTPYHGPNADAHSFAVIPTANIETAETAVQSPTLTTAPWQPPVGRNMFDPQVALFDVEGSAAPTPTVRPLHAVETATLVAPAPQIRKRPVARPGERNHAGLGHNHKAVSPDPDAPNLIGDIFARMFGPDGDDVDAMVEAEQTAESLANKISDRIVAEERLDLGYSAPDADLGNLAPGTDDAHDATIERLRETTLGNIDLYVGKDTVIGTPYDAKKFGPEDCIERALHGSIFCLANLHWPAEIVEKFAVDTAFTLPGEALIRFENGTISRVYAIFDSQSFADVVKHMQRNFGAPSEREIVWMPVMESPRLPNTTFRWKALSADRKDTMVLEVRNYDDLRRSFADMEHGLVRLYRDGSRPIFKHISTMDLMLMQRKRAAHAPIAANAPPQQ